MRHLKVDLSEQIGKIGWGEGRHGSCRCSLAFTMAPAGITAVKGQGATPTGQIGRAETAIGPGWLAHIEAESRYRVRE